MFPPPGPKRPTRAGYGANRGQNESAPCGGFPQGARPHIAGLSMEPSGSWGTLKLEALAASNVMPPSL